MFNWWSSPDAIAKLGMIVSVLILLASGAGLTLKIRGDHLKKLATAASETKSRPRQIPPELRKSLANKLRTLTTAKIEIECPLGDTEALEFATHFKNVFEDAGWTVDGITQSVFTGSPKGLILRIHDTESTPYSLVVPDILKEAGFSVFGAMQPAIPAGTISLLVGHKE